MLATCGGAAGQSCEVGCGSPDVDRLATHWSLVLYHITRNIWQGPFITPEVLDDLRRQEITHVLNVSDSSTRLTLRDGPFRKLRQIPVKDLVLIPADVAVRCLDALHEYVCDGDSNVYVHCVAGWHRSPTLLWLYLIACGVDAAAAKAMITSSSPNSVPAHPHLVDDALVAAVLAHGAKAFRPHPRPEAIEAVSGGDDSAE